MRKNILILLVLSLISGCAVEPKYRPGVEESRLAVELSRSEASHHTSGEMAATPRLEEHYSVDEFIARALRMNANLMCPEEMEHRATAVFTLRVTAGDTAPGETFAGAIPVSPKMKAVLTGDGIEVLGQTDAVQAMSASADTTWTWHVKAVKPGELVVFARVYALLGGDVTRELLVLDKTVVVNESFTGRLSRWATEYWMEAFIVPALLLLLGWWLNRKKNDA